MSRSYLQYVFRINRSEARTSIEVVIRGANYCSISFGVSFFFLLLLAADPATANTTTKYTGHTCKHALDDPDSVSHETALFTRPLEFVDYIVARGFRFADRSKRVPDRKSVV